MRYLIRLSARCSLLIAASEAFSAIRIMRSGALGRTCPYSLNSSGVGSGALRYHTSLRSLCSTIRTGGDSSGESRSGGPPPGISISVKGSSTVSPALSGRSSSSRDSELSVTQNFRSHLTCSLIPVLVHRGAKRCCEVIRDLFIEIPDFGVEAVLGGVVVPTEETVLGRCGDTSRVGDFGKV